MATQVSRDRSSREHGEVFEMAKKFFAEQQIFLNQVQFLNENVPGTRRGRSAFPDKRQVRRSFPWFGNPLEDLREYRV